MAGFVYGFCPPRPLNDPAPNPDTIFQLFNTPISLDWKGGICNLPDQIFGNDSIFVTVTLGLPRGTSLSFLSDFFPRRDTGFAILVNQVITTDGITLYNARVNVSFGRLIGLATASATIIGGEIQVRAVIPQDLFISPLEPERSGNAETHVQFIVDIGFTYIRELQIVFLTQSESSNITTDEVVNVTTNMRAMLAIVNKNQQEGPLVEMMFQTDMFGNNLGEMNAVVVANKSYPGGYPLRLIGECEGINVPKRIGGKIQTLYSAKPCLASVLKGEGDTLQAQTDTINLMYNTKLSNCEFYNRILAYSTLKYFFAGLVFECFQTKWLLRKYNNKFMTALLNSEFRSFAFIFINTEFGIVGFDQYYRCCKLQLCNCHNQLK